MKRALIAARTYVQEAAAAAQRAGDSQRAGRLRAIADVLADELDDVDRELKGLP